LTAADRETAGDGAAANEAVERATSGLGKP
jgi:hypothetical protein